MISSCWAARRAEVGDFVDRAGGLGEPLADCAVVGFESQDLRVAGVRDVAGLLDRAQALLESYPKVGVGASAVEGGAIDTGFYGKGLGIAAPAGWDLAAQESVDGGADPILVLETLGGSDSHVPTSLSALGVVAAPMSAITRDARS
ncbi:hypothetical protein [Saccharopolyspora sp. NPDC050642]|uniref:hypothetical protein n=1 Tax=Saccharopolyspora sp. NPDC050642 TaxID=3157099 RepID=UPI00340E534A